MKKPRWKTVLSEPREMMPEFTAALGREATIDERCP